jgi:glycosyltransferase involved in cell wall biosynthesis
MQYDCVIATKNRLNALRMSIPLILKQDVLPGRLIVIDASDDHDAVKTEVAQMSERLGYKNIIIERSDASNLPRQRNIGLRFVEAPVVTLPDDDSMWHSGFATNVLKIYEADVRGQVGGVSGVSVSALPSELAQPTYKRNVVATAKSAVQLYRNEFERHFFRHPFELIAEATWTDKIDVVDGMNSVRLPHITGYRMSFRTEAVRQVGFNETLGYAAGYAYYEDFDVSLRLERAGYALVSAQGAKMCHYSFPGKRNKGYNYGFIVIANTVYICRKTIDRDTKIYPVLERYLKYKLSLYRSRMYSEHNREVFQGAFDAWRNRSTLLNADEASLPAAYKALCDRYIKK